MSKVTRGKPLGYVMVMYCSPKISQGGLVLLVRTQYGGQGRPNLVPAKAQQGRCDHDTGPRDFALDG